MSDNSTAWVLSFLPNTTYDLPACAFLAYSIHQSQAGKSHVVFGKKDNTHAVKLSDIAAGIDGFVII
jgi:hypothetical protein